MLHWLLSLGILEVAIGQCKYWGAAVPTEAPAHTRADNVVPDVKDSGKPPLAHGSDMIVASTKKLYYNEAPCSNTVCLNY